jgi:hypothetical protein
VLVEALNGADNASVAHEAEEGVVDRAESALADLSLWCKTANEIYISYMYKNIRCIQNI